MVSGHLGSGFKSATGRSRPVDLPSGRASVGSGTDPARDPQIHSGSRPARSPGLRASPLNLRGDSIERNWQSDDLVLAASLHQPRYLIRLLGLDDLAGSKIPLRSSNVAGALREVHLHSLDSSGFELWGGNRLILKFFRRPISVEQALCDPDTTDGPHRGLSGS